MLKHFYWYHAYTLCQTDFRWTDFYHCLMSLSNRSSEEERFLHFHPEKCSKTNVVFLFDNGFLQPFCCDCYSLDNIVEHLRLDLYLYAQNFSFYFQLSTKPFNPHFEFVTFTLGFQANSKSKARMLFIEQ